MSKARRRWISGVLAGAALLVGLGVHAFVTTLNGSPFFGTTVESWRHEAYESPPIGDDFARALESTAVAIAVDEPTAAVDEGIRRTAAAIATKEVVIVGEAAHGTREFANLKGRLFRTLAADHGFRVLVLEAGFAETLALDDHVHGRGPVATTTALLTTLGVQGLATMEFAALVDWIRAWNAAHGADDGVDIVGIDMQTSAAAMRRLRAFLEAEAMPDARSLDGDFDFFETEIDAWAPRLRHEIERGRVRIDEPITRLRKHLDAHRSEMIAATSERAYAEALHLLAVVEQRVERAGIAKFGASIACREEAMVDNLAWTIERHRAGAKLFLWTHNVHAATVESEMGERLVAPLGALAKKRFGSTAYSIGGLFHEGAFLVKHGPDSYGKTLRALKGYLGGAAPDWPFEAVTVGPYPHAHVVEALGRFGPPAFFFDLEGSAAAAPIALVLGRRTWVWHIGASFSVPESGRLAMTLSDAFDALLFVRKTHAAAAL